MVYNKKKQLEYNRKWRRKNPDKVKEGKKRYRENNKDKIREWNKAYRKKNKEKIKIQKRAQYKRYCKRRRQNPKKRYSDFKKGAKNRNLIFEISYKDFLVIWNNSCIYCGEKKEIGLDRINNNKGYVLDNVTPACPICNFMRGRLSQKDFINHCKKVAKYQLKTPTQN